MYLRSVADEVWGQRDGCLRAGKIVVVAVGDSLIAALLCHPFLVIQPCFVLTRAHAAVTAAAAATASAAAAAYRDDATPCDASEGHLTCIAGSYVRKLWGFVQPLKVALYQGTALLHTRLH